MVKDSLTNNVERLAFQTEGIQYTKDGNVDKQRSTSGTSRLSNVKAVLRGLWGESLQALSRG